jgi:hypothetical protein
VHVTGLGFAALTLDLSDTHSLAEAQAKIAAYAAKYPGRPWIIGGGWNQETWGLGRFPTAAELDAVVSDRPVWLERVDGHAGWANSRALAMAGVTAATKDPAGAISNACPHPLPWCARVCGRNRLWAPRRACWWMARRRWWAISCPRPGPRIATLRSPPPRRSCSNMA